MYIAHILVPVSVKMLIPNETRHRKRRLTAIQLVRSVAAVIESVATEIGRNAISSSALKLGRRTLFRCSSKKKEGKKQEEGRKGERSARGQGRRKWQSVSKAANMELWHKLLGGN